jgi:regulator of sigma E protease
LARLFGIKVIRFSVGFGKPLLKWKSKKSGTQFQIAWFPLGGFVKLLDAREGAVDEADLPYEFMGKSAWKRLLVVAAGPVFNLLFAVLIYWVVFLQGQYHWRPVIAEVFPDSVAAQAGLQSGDEIALIGSREMRDWNQAQRELLTGALEKAEVKITLERSDQAPRVVTLDLGAVDVSEEGNRYLLALGVLPVYVPPAIISGVVDAMPAELAGLEAGDVIVSINESAVYGWDDMQQRISALPGQEITLGFLRKGNERRVQMQVREEEVEGKKAGRIGIQGDFSQFYQENAQWRIRVEHSIPGALFHAVGETVETGRMILRGLWSLVSGSASLKNISGPPRIAVVAGEAMSHGWIPFLHMMAFVSISLAILNFLPIPVLDGGHMFFYFVEMIKGSPVSEKTFGIAQHIGLAILIVLMGVAFYNDFTWLMN